jgi:hypothetical protein
MTEIKFRGSTLIGTAVDDHGVFTDPNDGEVYAGEIVHGYFYGGSASVGVVTYTNGTTAYAECDADGEYHGRSLDCWAGGDTRYYLFEHGSAKEGAALRADGTCVYNGKACRADFAPFAALQATVLAIKARPHLCPHSRPTPACFRPHRPPIGPIGHVLLALLAGAGNVPHRQGARPSASTIRLRGPCGTPAAKQMHRTSKPDDAPAEGCTTRVAQPHA